MAGSGWGLEWAIGVKQWQTLLPSWPCPAPSSPLATRETSCPAGAPRPSLGLTLTAVALGNPGGSGLPWLLDPLYLQGLAFP